MQRRPAFRSIVLLLVPLALVAAACGGGSSKADGVASLSDSDQAGSSETSTSLSTEEAEQALLDYTQCLRDQGLDVPDPQVDAEGGLSIGGPRGGAAAGDGSDTPPSIDRDAMDKAQEVCGDPPAGAVGGFDPGNDTEFQDAALKFAQCMRDNGVDMADPDFSSSGPGGPPQRASGGSDSDGATTGGPFEGMDPNDPAFAAAQEQCQSAFEGMNLPGSGGAVTNEAQ